MLKEIYECRYCLHECTEIEKIKPCKCEGSLKYVHPDCLKSWIKYKENIEVRQTIENNNTVTFFAAKCEICKEEIKFFTGFENNIISSICSTAYEILSNYRNFPYLVMHMFLLYLFYHRVTLILYESLSVIKKRIKTRVFMKLGSELALVFSFSYVFNEFIVKFYSDIYYEKRSEKYHFINRLSDEFKKEISLNA